MQLRNIIPAILLFTLSQIAFTTLAYAADGQHLNALARIVKRAEDQPLEKRQIAQCFPDEIECPGSTAFVAICCKFSPSCKPKGCNFNKLVNNSPTGRSRRGYLSTGPPVPSRRWYCRCRYHHFLYRLVLNLVLNLVFKLVLKLVLRLVLNCYKHRNCYKHHCRNLNLELNNPCKSQCYLHGWRCPIPDNGYDAGWSVGYCCWVSCYVTLFVHSFSLPSPLFRVGGAFGVTNNHRLPSSTFFFLGKCRELHSYLLN